MNNFPIVFIPGLFCTELVWQAQINALKHIAPTQVLLATCGDNVAAMAEDILARAPEYFSLVGFSLGSWVAMRIMEIAPERVDRLALLSTTAGGLPAPTIESFRNGLKMIAEQRLDEYLEAAFLRYFPPSQHNNQSLKNLFFQMAHRIGAETGSRQIQALLQQTGPFQNLHKIICPTLVIAGELDRCVPPEAGKFLVQSIPNAQLKFISGAEHFLPIEEPEVINKLLLEWYST